MAGVYFRGLLGSCVVGAILAMSACTRPPSTPKGNLAINKEQENFVRAALDLLRQPSELGQFRDALNLINSHLGQVEPAERPEISKEKRDALVKLCKFSSDEIEEVGSSTFRPMDSHYLDNCFLWRDVARGLEIEGMPALDKARLAFAWVMRRVLLHEQSDDWLPPAQIVLRGYGNARDRGLILLEVLRQMEIEGCLVALPGPPSEADTPILVGALIGADGKSSGKEGSKGGLYLFDPRTGFALEGGSRRDAVTLDEARVKPGLLATAGIPPDQASKLEAFLSCPLSALSPRMAYLEKMCAAQDRIVLFQDMLALRDKVAAASTAPVSVWNAPAGAKSAPPPSPVRSLRLYLPADEGGIDRGVRHKKFLSSLIPWPSVLAHYQNMKFLTGLPEHAQKSVERLTGELFSAFYVQPEEMMLRGRHDAALKRLDRIRTALEYEDSAQPLEDADLEKRVADWRRGVKEAYTAFLVRKEEGAQAKIAALWGEDQYLLNVLKVDSEIPLKQFNKKLLGHVVLSACKGALGEQVSYLVASSWHERAAQLQARVDFLHSQGKDNRYVKENAQHAWANARGEWNKFLDRYNLGASGFRRRLEEILTRWNQGDVDTALNQLEQLHLDLHTALAARLRLAEAQQHALTDPKIPLRTIQDLAAELQQLQDGNMAKELTACLETARGFPQRAFATRLELLARNWAPQGNMHWLKEGVQRRLASMK